MSKRLLYILLFALLIRLMWIFLVPVAGDFLYPNIDADGYRNAAKDIRNGVFLDNVSHIKRMPLYPSLLSLFSFLPSAAQLLSIRIWHCALDICTICCVFIFMKRCFNERAAILSALLYAVYPLALYRLPLMNTELIQGAALAFWLLGAARMLRSRNVIDAIYLSLISAIMVFISPALQLMPVFFTVYLFISHPWKTALRLGSVLMIPFIIICVGWGLRNYALTDHFFLFDSRGGKEFWLGNNQDVDGCWEGPKKDQWRAQWREYQRIAREASDHPLAANKLLFRKGVEQIMDNPGGAVILFAKKFIRFWYVPASGRLLNLTFPLQSFYLLIAIFGLYKAGLFHRGAALPFFVVFYYCAIYTLSYSCIRFSLPIMPWVCALGGIGLSHIWNIGGVNPDE
jgi:dolichyl-phosphate-mannose-protein mannosyltransferase